MSIFALALALGVLKNGAVNTAKNWTTATAIVPNQICAIANVYKDFPEFNVEQKI